MIDSAAHRDPAPADDEAVGESVLWLIRHGESTWNKLGLAQGHNDVARLTRRGRRQARITADRVSAPPGRLPRLSGWPSSSTAGSGSGVSVFSREPLPR